MSSKTWKQIIIIHILSNISRSKSNETMKFSQSIEYNIINFLKKSQTKYDGETSPRPFIEKSKLSASLDKL